MPKRRFDEIDVAKGIGILLVVIGHSFPDVSTSAGIHVPFLRGIHDVIYTFHMPLLFMLAGFLSHRILIIYTTQDRNKYIKDRFIRLMIPYFVIGLLYMPIKIFLSNFASRPYDISSLWQILVGENPDGGLWYLWVLFVVQVFLSLFVFDKRFKMFLIFTAIASLMVLTYEWSFFRLDDAIYYTFYILLGLFIRIKYERIIDVISFPVVISVFFVLCLCIYITIGLKISVFKFFSGFWGCIFILTSCCLFARGGQMFTGALRYLAKYSMDIYVLHGIVMVGVRIVMWSLFKINYYICSFSMFMGGLLISILISKYILRKNKLLKMIILGEKVKEARRI